VLSLGSTFAIFVGWYYRFPKMTGSMYSEFLGKLHFSLTFIGVNLAFSRNISSALPACRVELLIIAFAGWSYVSSDREQRGVPACPRGTASKPREVPSFSSLTICLHCPGGLGANATWQSPEGDRHQSHPLRGFGRQSGRITSSELLKLLLVSQNC
jgi:hypothetical protein